MVAHSVAMLVCPKVGSMDQMTVLRKEQIRAGELDGWRVNTMAEVLVKYLG